MTADRGGPAVTIAEMGLFFERPKAEATLVPITRRKTGRRALVALTALIASHIGRVALAQSPDDHPYFTDEFTISEGQGAAKISVLRDAGTPDVTVTYATKPSNAKEGLDYSPARGQLHFPSGDKGPKTFDVHVVDDVEPEEEESLLLLLYDSAGNTIDFSELTIISNEAEPADPAGGGPNSDSGGSTSGSDPRAGSPNTGPGSRSAGTAAPGAAAAQAGSPLDPPGGQGIPVIELFPRPEVSVTETEDNRKGSSLATSPDSRPSRKSPVGFVASLGLILAASGLALYFLWSRRANRLAA